LERRVSELVAAPLGLRREGGADQAVSEEAKLKILKGLDRILIIEATV
jgi:hypothetical protein